MDRLVTRRLEGGGSELQPATIGPLSGRLENGTRMRADGESHRAAPAEAGVVTKLLGVQVAHGLTSETRCSPSCSPSATPATTRAC